MCKQKEISNLVKELDSLFSQGVGHVNFTTQNGLETVSVDKKFTECEEGKNACGIPTMHFENEE